MLCLLFFIIWTAKAFVIHIENEYAPMYSPSFYSEKGGLYYLPDVIRASEKDEIRLDYVIPIGGTYSGMITFDIANESDKLLIFWIISNPEDGEESKTIFRAIMSNSGRKASQHELDFYKNRTTTELDREKRTRLESLLTWYLLDSQAFVKIQRMPSLSSGVYYIRSTMNHLYLRYWKGKLIYDNYTPQSDSSFRISVLLRTTPPSRYFRIQVNDPRLNFGSLTQNPNNTFRAARDQSAESHWEFFWTEHNWFAMKVKDLFIDALNCVGRTGLYAEPCFPGSEVLPVSSDEITPSSISFEFIYAGSGQSRLDPRVR